MLGKWICLWIAVCMVGCQSPQTSVEKRSTLRLNIGNDPNTLDPRKARDLYSQALARLFFEGLTRVGKNGRAELAIAESVSYSGDATQYTFYLKDAYWSNGDRVTAYDFVHAWKTLLDPAFPSDVAFQLYPIKNAKAAKEGRVEIEAIGARALDEKTLQIDLEYPVPYFLELTAIPAFFPINSHVDRILPKWADQPSSYVSNGPFCLKEWKHNACISAAKNARYWDVNSVKLSELECIMVTSDAELKMFEKGELDWAGSPLGRLPVDALATLKRQNLVQSKEMLGTYFIRVNTECKPFQDAHMRRAFALAINRRDIVDHVTQGNQIPATGFVPLSMGLREKPYFSDGAVAEARVLFHEALEHLGLSITAFPEIKLLYASSERNHLIAQALEQQWYKAFGIRVKLEACERKVYFDRLSEQAYQLASSDWIADFNDPINFLDMFRYRNGSSNNTNWENAEYSAWLERSTMEANPQERMQLLRRGEEILMEQMPILPLFHHAMLYLEQPHLKDVVLTSMGTLDFKWAEYK